MKIDKHIPKVSEIVEDKSLEETDPYTYYNRYSGYTSSTLNSFNTYTFRWILGNVGK